MARPNTGRPPLFSVVVRPIQAFFHTEAAGGILLLAATVLALFWANSGFAESYEAIFEGPLVVGPEGAEARFTLREFINDALMAIFFLMVGMEIKRELLIGELRSWRRALLPALAAVGGMVLPAGLYFLLTRGTPGEGGWGIPVATDIAFAIGCLTLLKGRVSHGLIVFLTALAIFDDIGGILVIAIFYGSGLHWSWLGGALIVTLVVALGGKLQVRSGLFYALGGVALWYAMHHGGVHATIAGVVLGMCVPAHALRPGHEVITELHGFTGDLLRAGMPARLEDQQLLVIEERLEELEPPLNRFTHMLHPYVSFLIIPLFALANAGVHLEGMSLATLGAPVALGIILGLLVGKTVGIFGMSLLAVRTGLSLLPEGSTRGQLLGVAAVGGIGFTVSLFIAQLAFAQQPALLAEAKLGVLVGSGVAAVLGMLVLRFTPPRQLVETTAEEAPAASSTPVMKG